jgi:predicted phage tail protein
MLEFVIGGVVLLALLIPITAILLDSPLGRSFARRMDGRVDSGNGADVKELQRKVDLLEADLEEMKSQLSATRDEVQFVQKLLEKPKH